MGYTLLLLLEESILYATNTHPVVSPTFTFKTRLPSTAAAVATAVLCCARLYPNSFLLEIVYRWMDKRTEKSCFEMVQGKQEVLTGDPDGWTWDEFESEVMRWA